MKHLKNITKNQAIFFAIAGLILGTVLTFGVKYWNVPIKEEDARHITATFSSYKETKRKGHIQEIIIQFEDHEQLYIDGVLINKELQKNLTEIPSGTEVSMLVHSNSNTILQMDAGSKELLDFQDSIQKLSSESTGFMYLGIFMYILSAAGMLRLFLGKIIANHKKSHTT